MPPEILEILILILQNAEGLQKTDLFEILM